MTRPILERILENSKLARHYQELVESDLKQFQETMGVVFGATNLEMQLASQASPQSALENTKIPSVEAPDTTMTRGLNDKMVEALKELNARKGNGVNAPQIKEYFFKTWFLSLSDKQIANSRWYLGKKNLIEGKDGLIWLK